VPEFPIVLAEERDRLQQLLLGADRPTGIRTGFRDLDALLGDGLQPGHLIVLASRPGHGKSALALQLAASAGLHDGKRVVVFSPEARELELVQRLWAWGARVGATDLRTASLQEDEWQRAHKAYQHLRTARISIDDTPGIGVEHLCERAQGLAADDHLELVIVDSLQALARGVERSSSGERLRRLKRLAQDLETPVVVTVRLPGREIGEGGGERALLEDLRTSVAEPVEEEADVVMALDLDPALDEDPDRFGEADLYVTKNRGGSRGAVVLCFLYRRGTFHTLVPADPRPPLIGARATIET
jgi:replicative DNA helicase